MSDKFFITFTSPDGRDSRELEWDLLDNSLAKKWFATMAAAIQAGDKTMEQNFWGFQIGEERRLFLAEKLNQAIAVINAHFGAEYQIAERAAARMDQDLLNRLHHHFEILVGQSWNPSPYLLKSPHAVVERMRHLNDAVHEYEHIEKAQMQLAGNHSPSRGFQCFLLPYEQKPLSEEDLKLFSFEYEPGDLVTNYCQLGKSWFDCFLDKDEHIYRENISPLRFYSSSFMCTLFHLTAVQSENILRELRVYIEEQSRKNGWGIDSHDPKNALGAAPYAKPAKNSPLQKWSEKERTDFFLRHLNVSRLRIASGAMETSQVYPSPANR